VNWVAPSPDGAAAAERSLATGGRTITEADIVAFAGLTGDRHPLHTDAEWAGRSDFGERIAHGMLVLSYAIGLIDADVERAIALRRIASATFKLPVRIGDTIRAEGRVESVQPLDAGTDLVATRWRVRNQDGATVALFSAEILERRPVEAGSDGR
jgi:3-hydroxybutyryl-CoA dehydratase